MIAKMVPVIVATIAWVAKPSVLIKFYGMIEKIIGAAPIDITR